MYFFEEHLHGPEKVGPTASPDFCNNIGHNRLPIHIARIALYLRRVQSGILRLAALEAGRAEVLVGFTGSKDAVGGHVL
jgi:hypothetical protein